jgi:signal transduction histidine kinase
MFMPSRSKAWVFTASALVICQVAASLFLSKGFALVAVSDLLQCGLLLTGTLALLPNIPATKGRVRLFWTLMTVGALFWFAYQLLWTYFEVILRQEVPNPFVGDIVIFLHLVPMMAALAFQPQVQQDVRTTRLGSLDFAILLLWWVFLYLYAVIPWQYAVVNVKAYGESLNVLYLTEKTALLAALAWVWFRSQAPWKNIYFHWFGASLTYAFSSYLANWAIGRNSYYSGSLYDVPLAASMAWMTVAAVAGRQASPGQATPAKSASPHVWVARLGMIAIFSLPLFAIWSELDQRAPNAVRNFRLIICLGTMLIMGSVVFIRQHLLDRELLSLLDSSKQSYENLQRLQAQLVQTEKLASLGQLVSGAAHELNNPLTAMLGYSDLLLESSAEGVQRKVAEQIGEHIRHTNILVSSLLSFARQSPSDKKPLDLNALLQTVAKVSEPEVRAAHVTLVPKLSGNLPRVPGDSNGLLQTCLKIMNGALNSFPSGGGTIELRTTQKDGFVYLDFCCSHQAWREPSTGSRSTGELTEDRSIKGSGLEGCLAIIQEHQGKLSIHRSERGSQLRIELPAYPASSVHFAAAKSSVSPSASVMEGATLTLPPMPL